MMSWRQFNILNLDWSLVLVATHYPFLVDLHLEIWLLCLVCLLNKLLRYLFAFEIVYL